MEQKFELVDKYSQNRNCAQAVLCAYAGELGISEQTAYKMAEGFGGGIAGTRNDCGALIAAINVISFLSSDGIGGTSKPETYKAVRELIAKFSERYGSSDCRDIVQYNAQHETQCKDTMKEAIKAIESVRAERQI